MKRPLALRPVPPWQSLVPASALQSLGPVFNYKKGNEYFELLTEEVEWKTSGATVAGPSSRNFLTNPMEVILFPPSGIMVNSYILLPMKPNNGMREFNVGRVNQKSRKPVSYGPADPAGAR